MEQQGTHESEKSIGTLQERRRGQLPMLTLPPKAASQMNNDDHHPLETMVQRPPYNQHSIYSNEDSNASFSSNGLSSDQLLASTLFASRSESPMERPSNPAPRPRKAQQSLHIGDLNTVSVSRQRSLTRPERQRPKPSMVTGIPKALSVEKMSSDISTSPVNTSGNLNHKRAITSNSAHRRFNLSNIEFQDGYNKKGLGFGRFSWWTLFSRLATCCFPGWCLRICLKKNSKPVQQAWREKLTLVYIIIFCCATLTFLTFGLKLTICTDEIMTDSYSFVNSTTGQRERLYRDDVIVHGHLYPFSTMQTFLGTTQNITMSIDYKSLDLTALFDTDVNGACTKYDAGKLYGQGTVGNCIVYGPWGGTLQRGDSNCIPLKDLRKYYKSKRLLVYDWRDVQPDGPVLHPKASSNLTVLGDSVINLSYYLSAGQAFFGNQSDEVLRKSLGQDGSYMMSTWNEVKNAESCLVARYYAGVISSDTMGCIISQVFTTLMFAIIIGLVAVRFSMASVFHWFVAPKLVKPGGRSGKFLAWRSVAGGNNDPAMRQAPSTSQIYKDAVNTQPWSTRTDINSLTPSDSTVIDTDIVNTHLYTIMLVTCYSEGEASMRRSLDSLARTTYSHRHKVLFIVSDGMITGSGNNKSTPDILLSMLTLNNGMGEPKACTYMAIAEGGKQLNVAKVYAGYYECDDILHPAILVVKCGTEAEQSMPKPGNRGKRDSQLILMSFLQRVLFNDRLSELDYEIFWKLCWLMKGVTPDRFELVLMVDADTMVAEDSLTHMVAAMANDITIMGLCGETRIANKRDSWVTMIQVFEYYISHHYAKAFESVFGGVTCLPGCFCMYRIKAPKHGNWVPLLANPDIVLEYNQNIVTTLHAKNLLFLGEDRFLSTLMLRTFPKRQMMFLPQAVCKTVVPETFSVLLSQRRRWINSTVHNLLELVLVSDLCGIACLSMQFVVFMDLLGTAILPATLALAIYVIVACSLMDTVQVLPITVLVATLGLPAVLIVLTTRKASMFGWMLVYLLALPVWNFILPVYAFWHFDDFTWGHTRRVHGDKALEGHIEDEEDFDSTQVTMRKWEEWECLRSGRRKSRNRMTLITPSNASNMEDEKRSPPISPLSPGFLDRQKFGSSSPTPSIRAGKERDHRRRSVPNYYLHNTPSRTWLPLSTKDPQLRRTSNPALQAEPYGKRRASTEVDTRQARRKSDVYLSKLPTSASLTPGLSGMESTVTVGSLSVASHRSRRPSEATNNTGPGTDNVSNENQGSPEDPLWTNDMETSLQHVLKQYS